MQTLDLEPGDGAPDDPPPSPVRLLLYVVGAATVLLAGSLLVGQDSTRPDSLRRLDGTPAPTISREPIEVVPVALRDTCTVVTDHRNELTLSFRLANIGVSPVRVHAVAGHPPLGGVKQDRPTRSGGSCRHPGTRPPGAVFSPGEVRLYTIRWKLPDTCPEPYPLQVRVTYQLSGQFVRKSDFVPILKDLGGIGFIQCPKAVTEFPSTEFPSADA